MVAGDHIADLARQVFWPSKAIGDDIQEVVAGVLYIQGVGAAFFDIRQGKDFACYRGEIVFKTSFKVAAKRRLFLRILLDKEFIRLRLLSIHDDPQNITAL